MKKSFTLNNLNLPSIKAEKTARTGVDSVEEETDAKQVSILDQWSCQNSRTRTKKSKLMKVLFRESMGRRMKQRQFTESSFAIQAKLFLLRFEAELKKAHDINYEAIHKNIQFCSGIYENLYGSLLREIKRLKESLSVRYESIEQSLKEQRLTHIRNMEKSNDKENYKNQISTVSKSIEEKEAELQPIKAIMEDLEDARVIILKKCLAQGYDVRQEGLLWILRQLRNIFVREDFPKFLNDKEVDFLMNRLKSEEFIINLDKETLIAAAPDKSLGEIYDIVTRKRQKEFTMTNQVQLLHDLQRKQNLKLNTSRHQLISSQVLRLAKEELFHTKATKYQLIYKETLRKLNKFCSNQIHNKRNSVVSENKRESFSTLNLLSCFDAKVEDYLRTRKQNSSPKTQEIALDEILRNLRYQSYHLAQKSPRNPISVVACLVGWKKAQKIIENEMNSVI